MNKKISTIALCCFSIMAALMVWAASANGNDKTKPKITAIPVTVTKVTTMPIPQTLSSVGSLSPIQSVMISSEVAGVIKKIYYKDGQHVAKGVPLVKLNDAQDKAQLASKQADLQLSKMTYKRNQQLKKFGAASQQYLEQLQVDIASKQAAVKSTVVALQQKTLNAPIDGILGAFKVNVGDYVTAGQSIVELVNKKNLKVKYALQESSVPKIKIGQTVQVKVDAYPKKLFYGKVNYISPTIDANTRTVMCHAIVKNDHDLLSPGMFVSVAQIVSISKHAIVVPDQVVQASITGYFVYKIVNGQAAQIPVKLGPHYKGMVQILKGLKPGDVVVTAGQQKLSDGSHVKITNGDTP